MQTVLFAFKTDSAVTRRKAVLSQIKRWEGVRRVERFDPKTKDAELARIYYIYTTDPIEIDSLVKRLLALPEIEIAERPSGRTLA